MNGRQKGLAKELVGCGEFKWVPGMLGVGPDENLPSLFAVNPGLVSKSCSTYNTYRIDDCGGEWKPATFHLTEVGALCIPDLNDPATMGCLMALIRGLVEGSVLTSFELRDQWVVLAWRTKVAKGATEGEALASALIWASDRRNSNGS